MSGADIFDTLRQALKHRWAASRWLIFGGAIVWAAFWLWMARIVPEIYKENGVMENFQSITLVLGALLALSMAVTRRLGTPARILMAGVALFFFMFFLLEFDTRELDMPTLRRWTNGTLRNLWVGALAAAYGVLLMRYFKSVWAVFLKWLEGVPGLLMVISGFFWIGGLVFEKVLHFNSLGTGLFLEELMECEATLFMLAAVILTRFSRRSPLQSSGDSRASGG